MAMGSRGQPHGVTACKPYEVKGWRSLGVKGHGPGGQGSACLQSQGSAPRGHAP